MTCRPLWRSARWLALIGGLALAACATSPLGRQQFLMMSASEMDQMGVQAYEQLKGETPLSKDRAQVAYVRCVADQLIAVLDEKRDWEVNLFQDDTANAFALPGGKIGVNTGLLKVARTQDQLAAVIGHEIGHVLAQHSNERVSINAATQSGLAIATAVLAGTADSDQSTALIGLLGVGAQVGVALPFSRKHETEADVIGLQLMARAGFDPAEAVTLWQNMAAAGGGGTPQFLSTHPSSSTRIRELQARQADVAPLYQQARAAGRQPRCK